MIILKLAALIFGYIAALSAVRGLSRSFDYYIRMILGNLLKLDLELSLLIFAVCSAVLFISIWNHKEIKKPPVWRGVDFSLLTVLTFCVCLICVYYSYYARRRFISLQMLLIFSIAAYTVIMAFLMETTARIRDGDINSASYWLRFFRQFPAGRSIGLVMVLLLSAHLFYIFVICPIYALQSQLNIIMLLFFAFSLTMLTYLCSFLLNLSAEYDKANAEKLRAEQFKAELITNVSHDIRTPLTAIISYVELLKTLRIESSEFIEYVSVLDRKTSRLKTLIGDLMEASKAGTGNMNVDIREVNLSEIVGQITGEFDDLFAERGLLLAVRQPDEPVYAQADSSRLWRVLENLFSNAAKYSLPGTRVFAEITLDNGKPSFSLKNTSQNPIDMPDGALTEQFIRGDRARQTEGSGLGLYIAKSLVELMGGIFSIYTVGDLFEVEIELKTSKPI